jgi:hypothetical protein
MNTNLYEKNKLFLIQNNLLIYEQTEKPVCCNLCLNDVNGHFHNYCKECSFEVTEETCCFYKTKMLCQGCFKKRKPLDTI